jgi:uncharacterized protein YndB with AHSA1/START domain
MTVAAQKIKAAPVRKSIRVNAPQARAFDVFTLKIGTWWPPSHSLLKSPCKATFIEPRVGGRWYQVGEDGSECDNGKVLVWQPPSKVVLSWGINSKFVLDDTVESEVEVNFIPEGANATRVELKHWINAVDSAELRTAVDTPNGWTAILQTYAEAAGR